MSAVRSEHSSVTSCARCVALAIAIAAAVGLMLPAAHAAPDPNVRPAQPVAISPGGLILGGPEVTKLDWTTRSMASTDLDGDGLMDLAVINADRSRIELLYQLRPGQEPKARTRSASPNRWEATLEDSRRDKDSVVTGDTMYALDVGQLNGDNRPDLVYTNDRDELVILLQDETASWQDRVVLDLSGVLAYPGTLRVADLDGDGASDIVVLSQRELLVFSRSPEGDWRRARRYALPDRSCYGLEVADLNSDGRFDLLHLPGEENETLYVRLQQQDGGFGEERRFRMSEPRSIVAAGKFPGLANGTCLASVAQATGLLEIYRLTTPTDSVTTEYDLDATRFAAPVEGAKGSGQAMGDLDHDGLQDVILGDAKGTQVWVFLQSPSGSFREPVSFPSLAEVSDLATGDLDGDGADDLVVLSSREQTLGIASWELPGRLGFPRPLPLEGKPLAVTIADLGGDGIPEIISLVERDKKRELRIYRKDAKETEYKVATSELPTVRVTPKALRVIDANQDGKPDLAIFSAFEPLRIFLQDDTGGFKPFTDSQGLPDSLTDKLDPSAFSMGDLDGDGKAEMIIARGEFARAIRIRADGKAETVEQFNTPGGGTQTSFAMVRQDGEGKPVVYLLDAPKRRLFQLERGGEGVFRETERFRTPKLVMRDHASLPAPKSDGKPNPSRTIIFGEGEFWLVAEGQSPVSLETVATYETDLEDVEYQDFIVGNLDGKPGDELMLVDSTNTRVLEVLGPPADANLPWESLMHFPVFQQDPHYSGKTGSSFEPHEMLLEDLTGDGKPDLAILVHDRLLIYPQE